MCSCSPLDWSDLVSVSSRNIMEEIGLLMACRTYTSDARKWCRLLYQEKSISKSEPIMIVQHFTIETREQLHESEQAEGSTKMSRVYNFVDRVLRKHIFPVNWINSDRVLPFGAQRFCRPEKLNGVKNASARRLQVFSRTLLGRIDNDTRLQR